MKKVVYLAAVLAAFTLTSVQAQNDDRQGGDPAVFAKRMISNQANAIVKDLNLDDSKAADFKALFTEYKEKEFSLRFSSRGQDRAQKGEGKKEGRRSNISDSKADSLMAVRFEQQEKELQLQKEYYEKFKQQIGAAAAYRVMAAPRQQRPQMNGGPNRQGRGGMPGGRMFGGQDFPGGSF